LNKENISRIQRQLAHMIEVDPSARAKRLYPAWNGEETRPGQSRFARMVRQRDKVCQRCGEARAEEAHHLQRWSRRPNAPVEISKGWR
jgi:hypothetical protein